MDNNKMKFQTVSSDNFINVGTQETNQSLIRVTRFPDNTFSYQLSEEGKKCIFLRFLENVSDFTFSYPGENLTEELKNHNALHFISKLCAVGYLLDPIKVRDVTRAVIAVDEEENTNGRTGKSLLANLLSTVLRTITIKARTKSTLGNAFVWSDVTPLTQLVNIDDAHPKTELEYLFPNISGDWEINAQYQKRITIPYIASPKIYISTPHILEGRGTSFYDRQWNIVFSNFYLKFKTPAMYHGGLFIEDWNNSQLLLFKQALHECLMLYRTFGVVLALTNQEEILNNRKKKKR